MMPANPFQHESVMLADILRLFASVGPGILIDMTVGGGGHDEAILDAHPDLTLIGLDQDTNALAAATARLARFGDRVTLVHSRFDHLAAVLERLAPDEPIVAVLADLGVSSPQFDIAERGFSYRHEGPLDMRMNPDGSGPTAAELVNELPAAELARILRRFGDERFADRIARAVVAARPISTTTELAEIVRNAIPAATRRRGGHPAKRSFQALRIAVNDELQVLEDGLVAAIDAVAPGGRVAVISFHSGEDRIVKARFLEEESGGCTCPPGLPCVCGAEPRVRLLKRGGWTAATDELDANPRAASARLRAVEKLPELREVPT